MPIFARGLFTLLDQVARERSHIWKGGIALDMSTISRANICNSENMLCQMTIVDRDEFAVRKLSTAEKSVHKELVIHSLEVQVWGDSAYREQSA